MRDVAARVDRRSLVEVASDLVNISSPTGEEEGVASYLREVFESMGLDVMWQEVEAGRPNVVGILRGSGGGKTLMFNGHMDTSYSGREPWLRGKGFRPEARVDGGALYGLGISNMKGALACYAEAVRAIQDAGVELRGDVMIAAVVGEIEKTQWGEEFRGASYRGYAAGSRYLVSHGGAADVCILGEPTEGRIVTGHYGALWLRISCHGPFVHTAFSGGRLEQNAIVRMRSVLDAVLEWIPEWQERTRYGDHPGVVNVGSVRAGFPWRVSRTPERADLFLDVRVPPTMPMAEARRDVLEMVRGLERQFDDFGIESEVYVTAPGSEIDPEHELVRAIDESHNEVFGRRPERDTTRWFSDASVLTRYGIETVNYGTSSGLPGAEGEALDIKGLVDTAKVYALAATRLCGVAA